MKISLGSYYAGFRYKEKVKELLASLGHEVKDCGTFSEDPVDYPLFIRPAAEAVARGAMRTRYCVRWFRQRRSDGSEQGARRALRALLERRVGSPFAQSHDANVLSLGERLIPEDLALSIVRIWLETGFDGGRHARRVAMLNEM